MKRFKQILSGLLVTVLMTSTCLNASFAVSIDNQSLIYREIEKSLSAIIPEKEYYGLGDVDMGNLSIGEKIPTYEVVDGNLQPTSVSLYPIFDNTGALAVVAATSTVNGEIIVSISQTFVDTLRLLAPDSQISIIYDKNAAYLLSDGTLTKLTEYSYKTYFDRDDIETLTENSLASLCGVELNANKRLSVEDLPKPLGMDDEEIYLQVNKVLQRPYQYACWAACIACVFGYIEHCPYFTGSIVARYGSDKPQPTADVVDYINEWYSNSNVKYVVAYDHNYSNIWTSLYNDKPVIALFDVPNQEIGHFVVIRGISYWSVFSLMDPASEADKYNTGKITGYGNSKKFAYNSVEYNATLTLVSYGYGR